LVATISYGPDVAAHALLQKREMVVALEAVRNCRLVVVDFNYFSLTLDPECNDFPGFDSVKMILIFLKNGGGYTNERKGCGVVTGCSLDEMNDHSVCSRRS
jgi:hypothetical protein